MYSSASPMGRFSVGSNTGSPSGARLMFFPEGRVRVHVYGRPADMRKSFDGLYTLARQELGEDPLSGC